MRRRTKTLRYNINIRGKREFVDRHYLGFCCVAGLRRRHKSMHGVALDNSKPVKFTVSRTKPRLPSVPHRTSSAVCGCSVLGERRWELSAGSYGRCEEFIRSVLPDPNTYDVGTRIPFYWWTEAQG